MQANGKIIDVIVWIHADVFFLKSSCGAGPDVEEISSVAGSGCTGRAIRVYFGVCFNNYSVLVP